MNDKLIEEIEKIVEEACRGDNNVFGYGIWSHHIKSVVEYGRKLAIKRGCNVEIITLACLLHDYASIIDYNLYKEHHIHGGRVAEELLLEYNYPQEKVDIIKRCIYSHRGSVRIEKLTDEELCAADADAISHIVQVPSLMQLVYKRKGMRIDEGKEFVRGKLERSWDKLSELEKQEVEKEYRGAMLVLK